MIWKMTQCTIFCCSRTNIPVSLLRPGRPVLLILLSVFFLSSYTVVSAQTGAIKISCPEIDQNNDGVPEPLTFSPAPSNCEATIRPPAPQVEADCFNWEWSFEIWGAVEDPGSGEVVYRKIAEDNNHIATGISPGLYDIHYIVRDFCGNEARQECTLRVLDRQAPVPDCPEKYSILLRPENTNAEGTFLLEAGELLRETGAADNCGIEEFAVRRSLSENMLADYARQQYEAVWPDDFNLVWDEEQPAEYYYQDGKLRFTREAGIYFTNWTRQLPFNCKDASAPVWLEMRLEDAGGNTAHCRMSLEINNQLSPRCQVEQTVITCSELDFEPTDAAAVTQRFGAPAEVIELDDACDVESITEDLFWKPAECGRGRIERRFTLLGGNGLESVCTQVIEVEPVVRYQVRLPEDEVRRHCRPGEGAGVHISDLGCNLLAVSTDTLQLPALDDECYRLEVRHRIINWCEYDGDEQAPPVNIRSEVESAGTVKEKVWLEINYDDWEGKVMRVYQGAQESDRVLIGAYDSDAYRKMNPGYFSYSQIIRYYDNTPPEFQLESGKTSFCSTGNSICEGAFSFTLSLLDNCSEIIDLQNMRLLPGRDPARELDEQSGAFSINRAEHTVLVTGVVPLGSHRLTWNLTDACGNTAIRYIDFEVVDCQAPRPLCPAEQVLPLLPVDLDGDGEMESAMNTLWAEDLIIAVPDDCSAPLHFSLNRRGEIPDQERISISFSCDDPIATPIPVELHAWDDRGNHDYCEFFVILDDERNRCSPVPDGERVQGLISTESGAPVPGVTVRLSGRQSRETNTYSDGAYEFRGLQKDYDYTLQPWLNDAPLEGVTTYDLVLISLHILNITPISSPYKLIAADVNNSQTITTLDMVQLRKIVLNVDTELPNNASWRFVDARYVFPNPANPWQEPFPEIISINNLSDDLDGQNFVAVKVGDVSGNARQVGPAPAPEERSTAQLTVPDLRLAAGEIHEAPVYIEEAEHLLGCQFTLETDLEITGISAALAGEGNWKIFSEEGRIRLSWNRNPGEALSTRGKPLFRLSLRADRSQSLRESMRISPAPLAPEAYDIDLRRRTLQLKFVEEKTTPFTLSQNEPNPFQDHTRIHFSLPESGAVRLVISNSSGQALFTHAVDLPAGDHSWIIHRNQIEGSGLLFYTLKTPRGSLTRRMLLVDN